MPKAVSGAGSSAPAPVADSLAAHVPGCPPELAARLALVHVADSDDGRQLKPGEWLVTKAGALRRWDGFVARGEGASKPHGSRPRTVTVLWRANSPANERSRKRPNGSSRRRNPNCPRCQQALVGAEREIAQASEAERAALRALDQAESARERHASRLVELDAAKADLAEQRAQAESELKAAQDKRSALPDPESGRASLAAAQAKHEAARAALQSAMAELAAHDQALAVARERKSARAADIRGWEARAGDASRRLADMAQRFEEIAEERAVVAAKPASLIAEIERGDEVRARLGAELEAAEAAVAAVASEAQAADARLTELNETLSTAREARAGAVARAENEEQRREEMARISGERFQCPPPLLAGRFEFDPENIPGSAEESAPMERLTADRERIGPVNLVAAEELDKARSAARRERRRTGRELAEAITPAAWIDRQSQPRGPRAAAAPRSSEVDQHFQRLFTRLFEGGEAHLALVDPDDPLEAGLEIMAQPPGKRLQSLTLLSGGEQALTAVALIFALFLTNPAPICVLDEVDAPLDDANIERFCDLLDAMAQRNRDPLSDRHPQCGDDEPDAPPVRRDDDREAASAAWSASTLAGRRNCWRRSSPAMSALPVPAADRRDRGRRPGPFRKRDQGRRVPGGDARPRLGLARGRSRKNRRLCDRRVFAVVPTRTTSAGHHGPAGHPRPLFLQ